MEHLLHVFGIGGSCGEHMIWWSIGPIGIGVVAFRHQIKRQSLRLGEWLWKGLVSQ
jgi:hypothetical protein